MPRDSLRPALPGDTRSVGHSIRDQLLRTFPGIALLAGAVIRLLLAVLEQAGVPAQAVRPIEALSTLALVVGGGYFLIRLSMTAQRRLLWRVRRKLILSYIFIGFIPALLIVAFFLLCGLMLFFNFSSYLVQSRLRILTDQTRSIAQKAAAEIQRAGPADAHSILERTRAIAEERYPGISVVLLPAGSPACAGDTRPHGPSSASRAP